MLMEISIKVTGKMERPTATESSLTLTEVCTRENGSTINNMVSEQNPGILRKLNILDSLSMEKRLVMGDLNSKEATTKVNLKMENLMAKVFITFLIQVKFMMVISRRIIWMAKDSWFGQISQDMKEISKWVK